MTYRGRCPVCSAQLEATIIEVICPKGDYRSPIVSFEKRWEQYDNEELALVEKLLDDLKSYNTVVNENPVEPPNSTI